MTVSKRLRFDVLQRDNHTCRYCGASAPDVKLHVDHVIPVALGGTDKPENLATACVDCNLGKSSTTPDAGTIDDVSQDQIRWSRAMKAAAEVEAGKQQQRDEYREVFHNEWSTWTRGYRSDPLPLPSNWVSSLESMRQAGFPVEMLAGCVDLAGNSRAKADDTFRYFCGVVWKKLTEMQETARTLLAAEHG